MHVPSIMSMITKNDLNLANTNYEELSFKDEEKIRFEKYQKAFKYIFFNVLNLNDKDSKEIII